MSLGVMGQGKDIFTSSAGLFVNGPYRQNRLHRRYHPFKDSRTVSPATSTGNKRSTIACKRCRKRKIKCTGDPGDDSGCSACRTSPGSDLSDCIFHRVGKDTVMYELEPVAAIESSTTSPSEDDRGHQEFPPSAFAYGNQNWYAASAAELSHYDSHVGSVSYKSDHNATGSWANQQGSIYTRRWPDTNATNGNTIYSSHREPDNIGTMALARQGTNATHQRPSLGSSEGSVVPAAHSSTLALRRSLPPPATQYSPGWWSSWYEGLGQQHGLATTSTTPGNHWTDVSGPRTQSSIHDLAYVSSMLPPVTRAAPVPSMTGVQANGILGYVFPDTSSTSHASHPPTVTHASHCLTREAAPVLPPMRGIDSSSRAGSFRPESSLSNHPDPLRRQELHTYSWRPAAVDDQRVRQW